ncbi:hypothetical protein Hypma_008949 [Hypsizygus marmoreus]|uniref:Uncharacterized protein n=1 Tax=Hypsizygus marmoreus TaxID=39966 RepID=A0A369JTZ2_HYPMA|nr:hypothetical protein Hypma_008949 [Hypsizygus marmoreus]
MFDYAMLGPLTGSSTEALNDDPKFSSGHVYFRQQHTVQIIQLVEGPPPPPRNITSVIADSYASSSAYSSGYSSSSSSTHEDDESACSSYCSSDMPPEQPDSPLCGDESGAALRPGLSTETYSSTKRILAWRENFSSQLSATSSEPALPTSLKRKFGLEDGDDDMSHSSKRSRSQASQGGTSILSLGLHSCPACDASFMTRQSLRQHGRDAKANEACCVAVEYAFE